MTEHTCSTCRWWNGPTQPGYEHQSGECELVGRVGKGFNVGIRASSCRDIIGTGYSSTLMLLTKPDFGCNQWEEKE